MSPSRSAFLSAIALVTIALAPVRAYAAAPPRVVALAELASKPVEVAITSKHLTLIHFETGEVSMVAVGDPGLVSITVKGGDVLLKALVSSGSTNAFIWQAGRYTQWTFTVRQSGKDPRLIIVKDLVASAGAKAESGKRPRGTGEGEKPAGSVTAATASGQPTSGIPAGSATTSPSPQQSSAGPALEHPETARAPHSEACGSPAKLDRFIKTLTARQRKLFSVLLTEPSLATLQTLFLELSAQQRCDLLALLSAPASSAPPTTGLPGSIAPAPAPSDTDSTSAAQVVFTVTPQVVDGQLFLYYVLENHSEVTLLTDILRLRIFDASGNQLAFGINRATQSGYLGRLESSGIEYGIIAVDAIEKFLVLEWTLIQFRSGTQRVVRIKIPLR